MAKLLDLFFNISKLDPNKEYEFAIKDSSTVEQPTPAPVPDTKPEEAPPTPAPLDEPPTPNPVFLKQQEEIEQLKAINYALLKQTPITQPELSVEDMIYRAVIGEPNKGGT